MKDNKIDIMQGKCGAMYTMLNGADLRSAIVADVMKGIRQLQYDLELLRKCTLDNPDFKWDDNTSHGYTEAKVDAFEGTRMLDEDGFDI